jgi:hypothetical protein
MEWNGMSVEWNVMRPLAPRDRVSRAPSVATGKGSARRGAVLRRAPFVARGSARRGAVESGRRPRGGLPRRASISHSRAPARARARRRRDPSYAPREERRPSLPRNGSAASAVLTARAIRAVLSPSARAAMQPRLVLSKRCASTSYLSSDCAQALRVHFPFVVRPPRRAHLSCAHRDTLND